MRFDIRYTFEREREREGDMVMARWHTVLKSWWMRELNTSRNESKDSYKNSVESFKSKLRWQDNENWFDCDGVSLLAYAVSNNNNCCLLYTSDAADE